MQLIHNDLLEETPTGANTTHCTNSIVVQRATASAVLPPPGRIHRQSRHQRSLKDVPAMPSTEYVAGNRVGPQRYDVDISALEVNEEMKSSACTSDFAWLLSRQPAAASELLGTEGAQAIPAWSGFNAAYPDQWCPTSAE